MRRTATALAVLLIAFVAGSCLDDLRNRNTRAVEEQDYAPIPDTAGLRTPPRPRKESEPDSDKKPQDTLLPAIALEGHP